MGIATSPSLIPSQTFFPFIPKNPGMFNPSQTSRPAGFAYGGNPLMPGTSLQPRQSNAIGGSTWAGNVISGAPQGNANAGQPMLFQNRNVFSSIGGTRDDGYRIGPGGKTGDGQFHDTFGTGLGQIAAGSPMASMGRDLAAGRKAPDLYGQAANDTSAYDKNFSRKLAHGGLVGGSGTGDKIRALLDPREFVMKPEAVKRIGVKKLERMNDGEEPIKMREGGHVAKAKWQRQGIGTDYGSFGPEFSGALDERYIRNTIDPLTNMSRLPSQFDIDRKRRELLHSGDIEALAQFDHLNHATRSGDPGAIADARQRFLEFRAARNYYAGLQQPRMPSIADGGPSVDVAVADVQPGTEGISAMLQKAGNEALNQPHYTPNELSLNGPLRAGELRRISSPYGGGYSIGAEKPTAPSTVTPVPSFNYGTKSELDKLNLPAIKTSQSTIDRIREDAAARGRIDRAMSMLGGTTIDNLNSGSNFIPYKQQAVAAAGPSKAEIEAQASELEAAGEPGINRAARAVGDYIKGGAELWGKGARFATTIPRAIGRGVGSAAESEFISGNPEKLAKAKSLREQASRIK